MGGSCFCAGIFGHRACFWPAEKYWRCQRAAAAVGWQGRRTCKWQGTAGGGDLWARAERWSGENDPRHATESQRSETLKRMGMQRCTADRLESLVPPNLVPFARESSLVCRENRKLRQRNSELEAGATEALEALKKELAARPTRQR